jgi:hypothetical protein
MIGYFFHNGVSNKILRTFHCYLSSKTIIRLFMSFKKIRIQHTLKAYLIWICKRTNGVVDFAEKQLYSFNHFVEIKLK